jgi:site-specific recombinase XerD
MITQRKIPITGLLDGYEATLTEMGYGFATKLQYLKRAGMIVHKHENQGMAYIDAAIISDYSREIYEKYYNGGLTKYYYRSLTREIQRFVNYIEFGKSDALPSPLRGSRQELTPEFEQIADGFVSEKFHPNTRGDVRWVTRRYFAWLEEQGHLNMTGVGASFIQRFILHCSEQYAPSSIHNIKLYIKKLYAYLYATGRAESDYSALLSFTVSREKRVYPTLPKSDIAKLLDAIDRTSISGKRNYAIMMLGTVLGLRACDVIALKLTDIDWQRGEIKIMQSKTSKSLVLPLTQDVGEALQDYILHARPKSKAQEVFLRISAPHTALTTAVSIGEVYEDCCIAAGLPASRRFHNLRRSLGTSMVAGGVSVYDVAQVFGDGNVESVKPYIAADVEHLKMCALPFDGIAPMGGAV